MEYEEAAVLRQKIAELKLQLANLEANGKARGERLALAHAQALEAAIIALAIEVREAINVPHLLDRVSLRLTHTTAPAMRLLNTANSDRSADAVDSFASRLDDAGGRPKFKP